MPLFYDAILAVVLMLLPLLHECRIAFNRFNSREDLANKHTIRILSAVIKGWLAFVSQIVVKKSKALRADITRPRTVHPQVM